MFVLFIISISGFTIYIDRKIAAYIQNRQGPSEKYNIFQSFFDAIKIFQKHIIIPKYSNTFLFLICPLIILLTSILYTYKIWYFQDTYDLLWILILLNIKTIGIILMTLSFDSNIVKLSIKRNISQYIVYDILLIICFIEILFSSHESILNYILHFLTYSVFYINTFIISNRSPFDLSEAESELLEGYQTEYSGILWACIMLSEYMTLIAFNILGVTIFFGSNIFVSIMIIFSQIVIRWCFVRYTTLQMINIGWQTMLKVLLILLILQLLTTQLLLWIHNHY